LNNIAIFIIKNIEINNIRILIKNILNKLLNPWPPKFSDHDDSNNFMVLKPIINNLFRMFLLIKGRNNKLVINLLSILLPHNLLLYILLPFQ